MTRPQVFSSRPPTKRNKEVWRAYWNCFLIYLYLKLLVVQKGYVQVK